MDYDLISHFLGFKCEDDSCKKKNIAFHFPVFENIYKFLLRMNVLIIACNYNSDNKSINNDNSDLI